MVDGVQRRELNTEAVNVPMSERLLVIEDEDSIARILQLELEHEGFTVTRAADGATGLALALSEDWHLILLDVMLPKLNGIEVLKRIREHKSLLPIIMLTARDSISDKVIGLEHGATDYMTKPFAMEELLARIRNLLRIFGSQVQENSDTISIADLVIEHRTRKVTRLDQTIELTPREFELLAYLAEHVNVEKTREEILSDVWGYDFVGETNLVDVYIRYLRQKVDKGFRHKLIQTIRGVGYMIKEPPL